MAAILWALLAPISLKSGLLATELFWNAMKTTGETLPILRIWFSGLSPMEPPDL